MALVRVSDGTNHAGASNAVGSAGGWRGGAWMSSAGELFVIAATGGGGLYCWYTTDPTTANNWTRVTTGSRGGTSRCVFCQQDGSNDLVDAYVHESNIQEYYHTEANIASGTRTFQNTSTIFTLGSVDQSPDEPAIAGGRASFDTAGSPEGDRRLCVMQYDKWKDMGSTYDKVAWGKQTTIGGSWTLTALNFNNTSNYRFQGTALVDDAGKLNFIYSIDTATTDSLNMGSIHIDDTWGGSIIDQATGIHQDRLNAGRPVNWDDGGTNKFTFPTWKDASDQTLYEVTFTANGGTTSPSGLLEPDTTQDALDLPSATVWSKIMAVAYYDGTNLGIVFIDDTDNEIKQIIKDSSPETWQAASVLSVGSPSGIFGEPFDALIYDRSGTKLGIISDNGTDGEIWLHEEDLGGGATTQTATVNIDAALQDEKTSDISLDAAIQQQQQALMSLDAVLANNVILISNLDAILSVTKTKTLNLDAALQGNITKQSSLDAAIASAQIAQSNLDAALAITNFRNVSVDAAIAAAQITQSNLDAAISSGQSVTTEINAAVQAAVSLIVSIDALISQPAQTASVNLDVAIQTVTSLTASIDAAIQRSDEISLNLDAAIAAIKSSSTLLDVAVANTFTVIANLNAAIQRSDNISFNLDAAILASKSLSVSIDAFLSEAGIITATVSLDAAIQALSLLNISIDIALAAIQNKNVSIDAVISATKVISNNLDLAVSSQQTTNALLDSAIRIDRQSSVSLDALLSSSITPTVITSLDAALLASISLVTSIDAAVQKTRLNEISIDAALSIQQQIVASIDSAIAFRSELSSNLDAAIASQQFILTNVDMTLQGTKLTLLSLDAFISIPGQQLQPSSKRIFKAYGKTSFETTKYGKFKVPEGGRLN